jgi:hypothetical protein
MQKVQQMKRVRETGGGRQLLRYVARGLHGRQAIALLLDAVRVYRPVRLRIRGAEMVGQPHQVLRVFVFQIANEPVMQDVVYPFFDLRVGQHL